jgi:TPR repeat protein
MKKLILLLFALLPLAAFAQQEQYTPYLEQAVEAARNEDAKLFNTSLRYFSAAIERDNITPGTLNKKNRELYTEALYEALSDKNFDLAEETAEKALQFIRYNLESNPRNMFMLGYLYFYGRGVAENYSRAKYWYEKAAENGDNNAMTTLAFLYEWGLSVPKDYAQAKYWYERAAKNGSKKAMENLSKYYKYGWGVDPDDDKANYWYEKAEAAK